MLEPQSPRLSRIQFHKRSKLDRALANDVLTFDLDNLVAGFHAGHIGERAFRYLAHEKLSDDRVKKKSFALDINGEAELLLGGAARLRE